MGCLAVVLAIGVRSEAKPPTEAAARVAASRAAQALAERKGCMECHGIGKAKTGPSFYDIAARYRENLAQYELHAISVHTPAELPEKQTSQVIVARVGARLHIRIFDAKGKKVIDKSESELTSGPEQTLLVERLFGTRGAAAAAIASEDRRALIASAMSIAGRKSPRDVLVETVKRGGKGNWTSISKGAPMPGFSGRLSDAEIGQIVDWLLGVTKLKVMATGLGSGRITSDPAGIDCGVQCEMTFSAAESVTLTATADADSRFLAWEGDASGAATTATVTMDKDRSVRANFDLANPIAELKDISPRGIQDYLKANPQVNSAARFVAALPADFKQNWILMTRSESLQTGTAAMPRILLPSADAKNVFTLGLSEHASYPASHPYAIEYMQWDAAEKNFRFHEVVVNDIPDMGDSIALPNGAKQARFPARTRGVTVDDAKCFKCHSTQNVRNVSRHPGTTGVTPGTIKFKSKPNWDTYDSWGGMMPFNRDRIYQGSVEAAAFRKLMNLWTWRSNAPVRSVIEQLLLQPPDKFLPNGKLDVVNSIKREDVIQRINGGTYDGHIIFSYYEPSHVPSEPDPEGDQPEVTTAYEFDGRLNTGAATTVKRQGRFVTLHHSLAPGTDEGRGVDLFDRLGGFDGDLNPVRIGDELVSHQYATGSVPIDIRPVALAAIGGELLKIKGNKVESSVPMKPLTIDLNFFDARNGLTIDQVFADTVIRAKSIPRRKADIQRLNLDRRDDVYLSSPTEGLISQYGAATSLGTNVGFPRLRQEVFRRHIDMGVADDTRVLGRFVDGVYEGIYVDREDYGFNSVRVALLRYFLEPLGVSVDKWSMGVRGRSRTYSFADVFPTYDIPITDALVESLLTDPRDTGLTDPDDDKKFEPAQIIDAINRTLASSKLPPATGAGAIPRFTDVQRIFNKGCIECHGGLNYPPYANYGTFLDLSEDEMARDTPSASPRLARSHGLAASFASSILERLTQPEEACPNGMMPCGGPALSKVDVETFQRWKNGGKPFTVGDPHIRTIDGTDYDFQAEGEFVFLRGENQEIQVRQTAIGLDARLGPNPHTGLTAAGSSLNTAVAVRWGSHRITYQPGFDDPKELELRVDGKRMNMTAAGVSLGTSGRIMPTIAPGGLQLEAPGGMAIVITPGFWEHYGLWYLHVEGRHVRATEGLMGLVAPRNWLPALPDGSWLGPRPEDLQKRYQVLYGEFGNAWRVTDKTSLFDYARGTSTATFTNRAWPGGIDGGDAKLPLRPNVAGKRPLKPVSRKAAERICEGIADDRLRSLAVQDVMVTGHPGFAETYRRAERIARNARPTEPVLSFPANNQKDVDTFVTFAWKPSSDADGDSITYRHIVWPADRMPDDNQAIPVGQRSAVGTTMSKTVFDLKRGQAYYWKVIAEDGKGGVSESVIRRFAVRL